MKKKIGLMILFVLIVLVAISSFILWLYSNIYSISNNNEMKESIKQRINTATPIIGTIDIKQSIYLDNEKHVLFLINKELGNAEFTKGYNDKYKIGSISYGSNPIVFRMENTNKGKYVIIGGHNYNNHISYAKALLGDKEYKITIPQQDYFLTFFSIPSKTKSIYPEIFDTTFYDKNNLDITDKVFSHLMK